MTSSVIPVVSKRFLDFAGLPIGSHQDLILADRLSLLHWREVTLEVQVHSHSLVATPTNGITFYVFGTSWTEEEPGTLFINDFTGGVAIQPGVPSPAYLLAPLRTLEETLSEGHHVDTVRVTVGADRLESGVMNATVSMQFSVKE